MIKYLWSEKDGSFGQWADETSDYDTYLTIDPADDQLWIANGVELTTADTTANDSGVKFRANSDWDINWGVADFSIGIGMQSGPNIFGVEGVYNVSLNTQTGEYVFSPLGNMHTVLSHSDIRVYPNPTDKGFIQVDLEKLNFIGDIKVQINDMNGSLLSTNNVKSSNKLTLDMSKLNTRSFLLQLSNDQYMIGKKITVIKKPSTLMMAS